MVHKLGTINHMQDSVSGRLSCHTGLTDKLQRNLANFTPSDSLSANGF